jgi:hypothetical protein
LFWQADIIFEEDSNFHATIAQLSKNFKCPIVITSEAPLPFLRPLDPYIVRFHLNTDVELKRGLMEYFYDVCKHIVCETADDGDGFQDILQSLCSRVIGIMTEIFCADGRACAQTLYSVRSLVNTQPKLPRPVSKGELLEFCDKCNSFYGWVSENFTTSDVSMLWAMNQKLTSVMPACPAKTVTSPSECQVMAPVIEALRPNSIVANTSAIVAVKGCGFLQKDFCCQAKVERLAVVVTANGVVVKSTVQSDDLLTCEIPATVSSNGGCVLVQVLLCTKKGEELVSSSVCGDGGSYIRITEEITVADADELLERQRKLLEMLAPMSKSSEFSEFYATWKKIKNIGVSTEDDDDSDAFYSAPTKKKIVKKSGKCKANNVPLTIVRKKAPKTACIDDEEVEDRVSAASTPEPAAEETASEQIQPKLSDCEDQPTNAPVAKDDLPSLPMQGVLDSAIISLASVVVDNRSDVFLQAVLPTEYPNYYEVIKRPMDLETIISSLAEGLYSAQNRMDILGLVKDVRLIWDNCFSFNGADSQYSRYAKELARVFDSKMCSTLAAMATSNPSVASVAVVTDNGIVVDGKTVFENSSLREAARTPSEGDQFAKMSEAELLSSLKEADADRRKMLGASASLSSRWRGAYSQPGLEYSANADGGLDSCIGMLPSANNSAESTGTIDALEDYARLLSCYGDADVLDTMSQGLSSDDRSWANIESEWIFGPRLRTLGQFVRTSALETTTGKLRCCLDSGSGCSEIYVNSFRSLLDPFTSFSDPNSKQVCSAKLSNHISCHLLCQCFCRKMAAQTLRRMLRRN